MRALMQRWMVPAAGFAAIAAVLLAENLGARWLNLLLLYLPGVDKAMHVLQSAAIFLCSYWLLGRIAGTVLPRVALAIAAALLFAVFDEVQQKWAGGRNVDAKDVIAATGGIAMSAAWLLRQRMARVAAVGAVAGAVLSTAIVLDSYYLTRDYNHGLRLEREGNFKDARVHLRRALAAGLQTADLFNYLAWVEIESGDGDAGAAVDWASRSLQMRPGHADTLDTYGWALHHAGRSGEALAPLEAAFAQKPDMFCIHYHLGVVLLGLGRRAEAVEHLGAQVKQQPRSREARAAATLLETLAPAAAGAA